MKIVIPGGSGQVGQVLARHFHGQGHTVTVLSRRASQAPWRVAIWDGRSRGDWVRELDGCDVCINLTGRSVNCRYTPENRREIYDSRVISTRLLGDVIAGWNGLPPFGSIPARLRSIAMRLIGQWMRRWESWVEARSGLPIHGGFRLKWRRAGKKPSSERRHRGHGRSRCGVR
ncbi:MAG: hypothetical protein JWM43_3418 [Acidobacteriaceae bacterium]|nr:hypothetical protein [Acidobacteriaceae bacterium]